jgi:hypothetical protein
MFKSFITVVLMGLMSCNAIADDASDVEIYLEEALSGIEDPVERYKAAGDVINDLIDAYGFNIEKSIIDQGLKSETVMLDYMERRDKAYKDCDALSALNELGFIGLRFILDGRDVTYDKPYGNFDNQILIGAICTARKVALGVDEGNKIVIEIKGQKLSGDYDKDLVIRLAPYKDMSGVYVVDYLYGTVFNELGQALDLYGYNAASRWSAVATKYLYVGVAKQSMDIPIIDTVHNINLEALYVQEEALATKIVQSADSYDAMYKLRDYIDNLRDDAAMTDWFFTEQGMSFSTQFPDYYVRLITPEDVTRTVGTSEERAAWLAAYEVRVAERVKRVQESKGWLNF